MDTRDDSHPAARDHVLFDIDSRHERGIRALAVYTEMQRTQTQTPEGAKITAAEPAAEEISA